ncbi:restriction endonuclease subunit S [Salmonella enterica subsp. enterica]
MVNLMVSEQQSGASEKGVPAGFKLTEVGVIPEDWECVPFGNLFKTSIKKKNVSDHELVSFIGMQDVSEDAQLKHSIQLPFKEVKSGFTYFEKGDVLLAKITPCFENGKGCHTAELPTNIGFGSTEFHVLRENEDSDYRFIYFWTTDIKFRSSLESEMVGSAGHRRVPLVAIKTFLIPCPKNKQEQSAIANTLSDINDLIIASEKLIAKKQAIKTATMQQLLTGKTRLPQFALRDDGTVKGYKKSELGDIPEDWDISTYGQVFSFLSTSTNARSDLSDTGECGYIHYGDIHTKWNNNLNLENSSVPRISSDLVSSSFIEDGDLIMADASEDYAGIGKSIEIQGVRDNIIVAGLHTYLLRDVNNIFVNGFRGYLHSIRAVKANIDRLATGMKVFGVSKNNLKTIPIPVPPKEEQIAIAAILSDMDKDIQTLQQRLDKTRQLKQGMMQELLTGKTRLI